MKDEMMAKIMDEVMKKMGGTGGVWSAEVRRAVRCVTA